MHAFIFLVFATKISLAQISGEFWWLNDKVAKLKGKEAPPPKFEDISEFDTDESDKIVFKDNYDESWKPIIPTIENKNITKNEKWKIDNNFKNENTIFWPSDDKYKKNLKLNTTIFTVSNESKNNDELNFHFPEEKNVWKNVLDKKKMPMVSMPEKANRNISDDIQFNTNNKIVPYTENICSYMKKNECYRKNGLIYKRTLNKSENDFQLICCILPLNQGPSKIIFPDTTSRHNKRNKRSAKDSANEALNQKNFLLRHKYTQFTNIKKNKQQRKILIDDDYEDPYWNIKNRRPKYPNTSMKPVNLKNNCHNEDNVEDYIVELPKPGLLGIYHDDGRPFGWTNYNNRPSYEDSVDDYEYDDEPGYSSTIDPRRSTSASIPKRGKPLKISTPNEPQYNPESQTVSYQSNPDFQVLQGFKLLNLARNKNKFYSNNLKKSTTESFVDKVSEESLIIESNTDNGNADFIQRQKFKSCGKVLITLNDLNEQHMGNAENGSHPWLALVVLTKQRQGILCYASIIHPRAAITSADCVYRRKSGDITIVTGVWDLKDRSRAQNRVTTSIIHPQYKPDDLNHNIALMHWTQPLRLNTNVQPACLGDSRSDHDCKIFGWGGFDQAIRTLSRWQRASILRPQECRARFSSDKARLNLSNEVFCASVQARGTVTGIGGPLICNMEGRYTIVGVAVWRDTVLIMLPVYEWAIRTLESLFG
ncbi:uncharacterized protein LOC131855527 [Achroia grisella]|uniref:uncharacterized protein LOC131855527 n=1 Tax=Achroia grisella TaxID=688607 RepID=UPI0027D2546B|nr:uncharacterized protein LOC131855527 [Achroia grisella]